MASRQHSKVNGKVNSLNADEADNDADERGSLRFTPPLLPTSPEAPNCSAAAQDGAERRDRRLHLLPD
jgi:hypothetical protein